MARTNNLTNFLTDVAEAIKTKKGSETPIPAANFDTEILTLPAGGNYQEKTVTISQNGQTAVTPDSGYDAMDRVEITVNVPIKQLQSKSYTFTQNQTLELLPDTGYDGFSSVEVTVNVPSGEGIQEYASVQAMEEAGLDNGEKAVVYNSTDKLVGYYNGAFVTGVRMVPAESITYDDVNHTATISQANSTVIGDEASIKNLLVEICTAYNWKGLLLSRPECNLFRMNDKWYAGVFKRLYNGSSYASGEYDGTRFIHTSNTTSVTRADFEYCELNLQNYTYGKKLVYTCSTSDYTNSSGKTSRMLVGPIIQGLPIRLSGATQSISYTLIKRSYSAYDSYTLNGDTTVVGPVSSINLLDNGLIYGSRDANATANDILLNKTAYVNGVKLVGTYEGSSGGSGDVKLFETEQAMQNDPNPSEGDLAVVYRSEVQPCTATAHFSKAIFLETVVLDSALEDYVELRFRPVDSSQEFECWGMIDQSMFEMSCHGEQGEYSVQYESQDGITYTRTALRNPDGDVTGNELDFGVEIYYEDEEMWNDVIGNFINVGGKYFEGLYEYGTGTDTNISCLGIKFSDLYPTYNQNILYQYHSNLVDLARLNEDDIYVWTSMVFKIQAESNLYYGQTLYKPIEGYSPLNGTNVLIGQMIENNTNYLIAYMISSPADKTLLHYTGSGFENVNILTNEWQSFTVSSSTYYYKILATIDPTEWVANYRYSLFSMGNSGTDRPSTFVKTGSTATGSPGGSYAVTPTYGTSTKYFYAPTQLTLKNVNELLPDIIAYGKNGVITGDGSIYDSIPEREYLKATLDYIPNDNISVRNWKEDISSQFGFINPSSSDVYETSIQESLLDEHSNSIKTTLGFSTLPPTACISHGKYQIAYSYLNSYGTVSGNWYISIWDKDNSELAYCKAYPNATAGFKEFGCTANAVFFVTSNNNTITDNIIKIDLSTFTETIKQTQLYPVDPGSGIYYQMPTTICDPTGEYFVYSFGMWSGVNSYKAGYYLYKWSTNTRTTIKTVGTSWVDYNLSTTCNMLGSKFVLIQSTYNSSYNTTPYIILYNPTDNTYIEATNIVKTGGILARGIYDYVNDKYYVFIRNKQITTTTSDTGYGLYKFEANGILTKVIDLGNYIYTSVYYMKDNYLYLLMQKDNADWIAKIDLTGNTVTYSSPLGVIGKLPSSTFNWLDGEKSIYVSSSSKATTRCLQLGTITNLPTDDTTGFTYKLDNVRYIMNKSILDI